MQYGRICVLFVVATTVLCVSAVCLTRCEAKVDPRVSDEQALTVYIRYFLVVYPERRKEALSYTPIIIKASQYERIDPLFITTMVSFESSWNTKAKGSIDETGLLQTHGVASKGHDVMAVEGRNERLLWAWG